MSRITEARSIFIGMQTMSNNTIVNYINSNAFTDGIYLFTVSPTNTSILTTSNISYMTAIQYTTSNNIISNISIKTLKTPIILSNSTSEGFIISDTFPEDHSPRPLPGPPVLEPFTNTNNISGYMKPNPLVGIDYHNF
jgi:hypothetical protein